MLRRPAASSPVGCLRGFSTPTSNPTPKSLVSQLKNVKEEAPINPETGDRMLYRGRHERSILLMLGVSFFNFVYWSYQLTNYYLYHGVVVQGIEMGGDVKWPILGMCGTAVMFFSTRLYSRNCVRQAYLSADGRRLGFQLHTIFAVAGPKVEAAVHNTSLVGREQQQLLMKQVVPVKLEGMSRNLLLDGDGIFYDNGALLRMLEDAMDKAEKPLAHYYKEKITRAERRMAGAKGSEKGNKK